MKMKVKQLSEEQTLAFDVEYVDGDKWEMIKNHLSTSFPDGNFTFIDIGGGNGLFADRILHHFPLSKGTIIDNSEQLLQKNKQNTRKTIVLGSFEQLEELLPNQTFDVVFFNWVLHHLVTDSYQKTQDTILQALKLSKSILTTRGYLSIFENMYDGLLIDNLPSHLIFHLTSSKMLAPVTKKLGANTAGCGVCFLSKKKWKEKLWNGGFSIQCYTDDVKWKMPFFQKYLLHIGPLRVGHFWCKRTDMFGDS
jgi:hypothetical protein